MATKAGSTHAFTISVDGEALDILEHELSPNEIMRRAEIDSDANYLVQIDGQHQRSYQGEGDTPIRIHEKLKLISVYTGPTTVS